MSTDARFMALEKTVQNIQSQLRISLEESKALHSVVEKLVVTAEESKVAFHCTINTANSPESIIRCISVDVNVGDSMSSAGTFTAPLDGVYMFTFSGWTQSDDVITDIRLRVDGTDIGRVIVRDDWGPETEDETFSISIQAIANLKIGQQVDAYLVEGYTGFWTDNHVAVFTGHLIFPL